MRNATAGLSVLHRALELCVSIKSGLILNNYLCYCQSMLQRYAVCCTHVVTRAKEETAPLQGSFGLFLLPLHSIDLFLQVRRRCHENNVTVDTSTGSNPWLIHHDEFHSKPISIPAADAHPAVL